MTDETMGQRLERLLKIKGADRKDLAAYCKVSRMTVHQWLKDTSEPRPRNLAHIAAFFGTDVLYVVFGDAREPAGGFPAVPSSAPARSARRRKI